MMRELVARAETGEQWRPGRRLEVGLISLASPLWPTWRVRRLARRARWWLSYAGSSTRLVGSPAPAGASPSRSMMSPSHAHTSSSSCPPLVNPNCSVDYSCNQGLLMIDSVGIGLEFRRAEGADGTGGHVCDVRRWDCAVGAVAQALSQQGPQVL